MTAAAQLCEVLALHERILPGIVMLRSTGWPAWSKTQEQLPAQRPSPMACSAPFVSA